MKTLLVTGGTGFIGSNFISFFLNKNKDYAIVNIDALRYVWDFTNLKELIFGSGFIN